MYFGTLNTFQTLSSGFNSHFSLAGVRLIPYGPSGSSPEYVSHRASRPFNCASCILLIANSGYRIDGRGSHGVATRTK